MISKYTALLSLTLSVSAIAQHMKMRQVVIPQYNEKRVLESVLRAAEMRVSNGETEAYNVQINDMGKNSTLVKSPYCKINMQDKKVHSKERLTLREKGLKISGVGYDYDMKKKVLLMHSNVRIELEN